METLITKMDLAENLSLSIGTIDNHMREGNLKYVKIGKLVRFREEDIQNWIRTHYKSKYMTNSISDKQVESLKQSVLGE